MKPRGIRNNNPLNIRRSRDQWQGTAMTQTDAEFVQFTDMEYGYRAAWKILQTYYKRLRKEGKPFTVRNIISRWAPPEDHNDTDAYIRTVLRLASIGGQEQLLPPENALGYLRLSQLVAAMTCVENGIGMSEVDTEAICQGYRRAFPRNSDELDVMLIAQDEYWGWSDYPDLAAEG